MKWLLLCGAPVIVAAGVYFHGPLRSGETYARPVSDVAYTLETMALPDFVASAIGQLPSGNSRRETVPDKSVTYYFFARGGQVAKYVAEMQPVDATHTRVSTYLTMSDDAGTLMKTGFMPLAKEFEVVGAATMNEQIDSRLEQRAFDKDVTKRAMAGFAMANIGAIQQSASEAMTEAAKMQDSRAAAYSQPTIVPGQPMVNPAER